MKIVVCVKQVPNTMEVKIDPKTGTLIRDKAPAILNTFDEFAIEESVQIREKLGGEVVALTMGPPNAKEVLLDAYALGADLGVHVNDRAVRGSDTFATAGILAAAVKKIQDVDLVICGKQVTESEVVCEREIETGVEVIRVKLPAVLTVLKDINVPRLPSYRMKMEGKEKETPVWGIADLGLQENQVGMEGSVTTVMKTFTPDPRGNCRMIEGSEEEMIGALLPVIEAVQ